MTNELGADARALIDQALSNEPVPGLAELERIRRSVVAGAASSAVMLAAPPAGAAAATPLALLGLALKGGAAGTLVVLAAFTADRYLLSPPPMRGQADEQDVRRVAPAESPAVKDARPAPAAIVGEVPAPPAPAMEKPPRTTAAGAREAAEREATAPDRAAGVEASADLQEETALLRRVQQELRVGRGARALELLDASSSRLERGQLRQERLAAEVLAACLVGDVERARRGARAFTAENPATPSAARLRSSCVGSEFFEK